MLVAYSLGIINHMSRYNPMPGIPPGIKARRKARRNQKVEIPKNSASPPHTPKIIRLLLDLRNFFVLVDMFTSINSLHYIYAEHHKRFHDRTNPLR